MPGAPGSVTDIVARPLAETLSAELRQPVVVENHPGAGGILAMQLLSQARPDGYTLAIASTSQLVFNIFLFDSLPYDPIRAVVPVTKLVSGKVAIVANPAFQGALSASSLRSRRRSRASSNTQCRRSRASPHLCADDGPRGRHRHAGRALPQRPRRSAGCVARRRTDSLRCAGVGRRACADPKAQSAWRDRERARCPTARSRRWSKVASDIDAQAWLGLVAPAGLPSPVAERIHRAVARVLRTPQLERVFEQAGFEIAGDPPDAFAVATGRARHVGARATRRQAQAGNVISIADTRATTLSACTPAETDAAARDAPMRRRAPTARCRSLPSSVPTNSTTASLLA